MSALVHGARSPTFWKRMLRVIRSRILSAPRYSPCQRFKTFPLLQTFMRRPWCMVMSVIV